MEEDKAKMLVQDMSDIVSYDGIILAVEPTV